MLHEPSHDGGLGFCHEALRDLLPAGYHGPMVIALDTSVLLDLHQHGNRLLNGDTPDVEDRYGEELEGLGGLIDLWLMRDIRFLLTPRVLSDGKGITSRQIDQREAAMRALTTALVFQRGTWNDVELPPQALVPIGEETGLPHGADRDLVLEAQSLGAHVFLTRDRALARRVRLNGPVVSVLSPAILWDELVIAGVTHLSGGICQSGSCPYDAWPFVAPDMGRWGPFMSIFE
jgi:hypothetical protein